MYYAVENPYGLHCFNKDGAQANMVYRFVSGLERDAWIKSDPKHRNRLRANHPYVRKAKKQAERYGLQWPISIGGLK